MLARKGSEQTLAERRAAILRHAFLSGFGSVLDLSGGQQYWKSRPKTGQEAFLRDWVAIHGDFNVAFRKVNREMEENRRRQLSFAFEEE
jgi:hypothetical protein